MSHISPDHDPGPPAPDQPCEPHHANLIRDRKKLRAQYGPYSYTKGYYFNGSETPMKPRNIRIQSSIPIVFAVVCFGFGVWYMMCSEYASDGAGWFMIAFAGLMLWLSWIGFRTARLREKWEHQNPELAKTIKY